MVPFPVPFVLLLVDFWPHRRETPTISSSRAGNQVANPDRFDRPSSEGDAIEHDRRGSNRKIDTRESGKRITTE